MNLPSTLCRAQEAFHRNRAAVSLLDNVRTIATGAATAWEREAIAAERREQRNVRAASLATIASAQDSIPVEDDDRLFSENPDRGFEDS